MPEKRPGISRREFAKRAALASAAGTLVSASPLLGVESRDLPFAPQEASLTLPKLAPQSQAEADARLDSILREYPGRFSEDEKRDLRRLSYVIQQPLDRLRSYTIANGDAPALYLKPIVEREKRQPSPSTSDKPSRSKS